MNQEPYRDIDDDYPDQYLEVNSGYDLERPIILKINALVSSNNQGWVMSNLEAFSLGMELIKRSGIGQYKASTFDYLPYAESQQEIEQTLGKNSVRSDDIPGKVYL